MSNSGATDSGVGRALLITRIRLSIQAAAMCFSLGWVPGFLLPIMLWFAMASPQDVDLVKINFLTSIVPQSNYSKWRMRDDDGKRRVITVRADDGRNIQYLTPKQVTKVLAPVSMPIAKFDMTFLLSIFTGCGGYWAMWHFLTRVGRKGQESQRLRGASDIVTPDELSRMVKKDAKGPYRLAKVTMPKRTPMNGIMVQGAQGSGKSLAIHDLMRQVFAKKKKCIIYDNSGEFFQAYFRPGKDFFFNPALEGSVPWSIFSELKFDYDSDTLAQAFLPPKGGVQSGPNAFFEDAARALFSVILLRLKKLGVENTRDIAKAFLEMPEAEMDELIKHSVASSAVGGDSKGQRQGVISSIAIYLNGIAAVEPGNWSIRQFLERDDDARFFILNTEDTRAMFAPLYRLMLTVSFAMIAAKQERVHEDRYWFLLDEVLQLGDIKIDEALATLRKYGVCIVAGIQSESQIVSSLGEARSETVLNCFNTILQLQNNEPKMKERAATRLGKMEMRVVNQNQALAVNDARDGAGLSNNERDKWVVRPEEIGELSECIGFLKFRKFPVAKVDYSDWLKDGLFGPCYAEKMTKAIQDTPPRNPKFLIAEEGSSVAPVSFEEVRDAMKAKVESAAAVPAEDEGGGRAVAQQDGATANPEGNQSEAELKQEQEEVDPVHESMQAPAQNLNNTWDDWGVRR